MNVVRGWREEPLLKIDMSGVQVFAGVVAGIVLVGWKPDLQTFDVQTSDLRPFIRPPVASPARRRHVSDTGAE